MKAKQKLPSKIMEGPRVGRHSFMPCAYAILGIATLLPSSKQKRFDGYLMQLALENRSKEK